MRVPLDHQEVALRVARQRLDGGAEDRREFVGPGIEHRHETLGRPVDRGRRTGDPVSFLLRVGEEIETGFGRSLGGGGAPRPDQNVDAVSEARIQESFDDSNGGAAVIGLRKQAAGVAS